MGRLSIAVVLVWAACAVPALAAYPGQNGKIAYAVVGGLKTMNPNGTGQAQLTTGEDYDPVWSPNGQQVAFVRRLTPFPCSPCLYAIHVVNADSTGEAPVTSPAPNQIETPTWSSDGQRIAYTAYAGGQYDIWVANADGSGTTQITATPADESDLTWSPDGTRIAFTVDAGAYTIRPDGSDRRALLFTDDGVYRPDWSPDGQSMVFMTLYICDGDTCADISTRRLDGTGGTHVIGSDGDFTVTFDRSSWSPDGTRVVLASGGTIFTIKPNGTGFVSTGVDGQGPDWQPLPVNTTSGFIRSRSAPAFRVGLVPAAEPCTAPNREHGPPLASGSCSPVQRASYLTVGIGDGNPAFARSVGYMRMKVLAGPPGPPNDSDVTIRLALTNVMRAGDLSEYTGELRGELTVRRTDRESGLIGSTSMDFPFGFTVPCAPTPESSLDGSTCITTTSVHALIPNAIKDTNRTIWALDKLRVYDGGPDENADTETGNSLFMTQGVFVP